VVTDTPYARPVTRTTLRRSALVAGVLALVAAAVLVPLGYGDYALFGCLGLALGLLNSALVVIAVERFSEKKPSKVRFSGSVLVRLAAITVLAFGLVLLFRPAGVAVFAGLAVFQFLVIVSSMLPLIKEIRQR